MTIGNNTFALFTEKGQAMKRSATLAAREIEAELERRLGAEDFAALRRILERPWEDTADRTPRRVVRHRSSERVS